MSAMVYSSPMIHSRPPRRASGTPRGRLGPARRAPPARGGEVGGGVLVARDPLPAVEARFEHAEQALRLGAIALQGPLVLDLPAGEFVEVAELAEHRPHRRHLEEHPLDGLVAAGRGPRGA